MVSVADRTRSALRKEILYSDPGFAPCDHLHTHRDCVCAEAGCVPLAARLNYPLAWLPPRPPDCASVVVRRGIRTAAQ